MNSFSDSVSSSIKSAMDSVKQLEDKVAVVAGTAGNPPSSPQGNPCNEIYAKLSALMADSGITKVIQAKKAFNAALSTLSANIMQDTQQLLTSRDELLNIHSRVESVLADIESKLLPLAGSGPSAFSPLLDAVRELNSQQFLDNAKNEMTAMRDNILSTAKDLLDVQKVLKKEIEQTKSVIMASITQAINLALQCPTSVDPKSGSGS